MNYLAVSGTFSLDISAYFLLQRNLQQTFLCTSFTGSSQTLFEKAPIGLVFRHFCSKPSIASCAGNANEMLVKLSKRALQLSRARFYLYRKYPSLKKLPAKFFTRSSVTNRG
jgi:hypothetical protein